MNKPTEFFKKYWIIGLLLIVFIILVALNSLDPTLLWDENVYLGNARSHLGASSLVEDFRPPLLEYMTAVLWLFTGESVLAAKLMIILFSLGSIAVFYLITRKLFRHTLVPVALFAFSSEFVFWGFRAYADIIGLFFILLSFYFFIRSSKPFYLLAGMAAAAGFLARFPLALFALSIGICCLLKKEWEPLLVFSAGFALGIAPWLVFNLLIYGNPLWDVFALLSAVSIYTSKHPVWDGLVNIAKSLFILLLFLPSGVKAIIERLRKNKNPGKSNEKENHRTAWLIISVYIIISLVYYLFLVKLKLSRYNLAFLPFLIAVCYLGIEEFFRAINAGHHLRAGLGLLLVVLMLAVPFCNTVSDIQEKSGCNQPLKQSIAYIGQNTNSNSTILSNEWVRYAYPINVNAYSLWSTNLSMLIKKYQPCLVAYHTRGGKSYNQSIFENSQELELEKVFQGACFDIRIFRVIKDS